MLFTWGAKLIVPQMRFWGKTIKCLALFIKEGQLRLLQLSTVFYFRIGLFCLCSFCQFISPKRWFLTVWRKHKRPMFTVTDMVSEDLRRDWQKSKLRQWPVCYFRFLFFSFFFNLRLMVGWLSVHELCEFDSQSYQVWFRCSQISKELYILLIHGISWV